MGKNCRITAKMAVLLTGETPVLRSEAVFIHVLSDNEVTSGKTGRILPPPGETWSIAHLHANATIAADLIGGYSPLAEEHFVDPAREVE
jgi:hypothetical protein